MTWDRRSGASHRARNAVNQLAARGIELGDEIGYGLANLDRIIAEAPRQPEQTAIRNAIVVGAPRDEIDRMLLAELSFTRLRSEHSQAVQIASTQVLQAVYAERDRLHAALRPLAQKEIAHLDAVAALDGATLEVLVREGRHDDAQKLAEVQVAGEELHALFDLRDSYLSPGGIESASAGHITAAYFRDPRVADRHSQPNLGFVDNWLLALRKGAELWYPTAEEAYAAAAPIYAEWEREAARVADKQKNVGGLAAF